MTPFDLLPAPFWQALAWTVDLRVNPVGLLSVAVVVVLGAVELDRRVWRPVGDDGLRDAERARLPGEWREAEGIARVVGVGATRADSQRAFDEWADNEAERGLGRGKVAT